MGSALLACGPQSFEPPQPASGPAPVGPHVASNEDAVVSAPAPGPGVIDRATRFIVPEADAARFYVGHHDPAASYFTPTEAEVAAFERDLPAFLARADDPQGPTIAGRLDTYRRHYVGVVREEGRLVFGNFFCATEAAPADAPLFVDDGGACFFHVFHDPRSGVFLRLSINGSG